MELKNFLKKAGKSPISALLAGLTGVSIIAIASWRWQDTLNPPLMPDSMPAPPDHARPQLESEAMQIQTLAAAPEGSELGRLEQQLGAKLMRSFHTGDFLGALHILEQGLQRSSDLPQPFVRWLEQQALSVYTAAGWTHLKIGNCEKALPLFTKGLELGGDQNIDKGLGICHARLQQFEQALPYLQRYIRQNPQDMDLAFAYADALEALDRHDQALTALQQFSAADPNPSAQLKRRIQALQTRMRLAQNQLIEVDRFFSVRYQAGQDELLIPEIFQTLESTLDHFLTNYQFRQPEQRIEVVLYPEAQFKAGLDQVPEWAQGIFDGRIRIPIPTEHSSPESQRVLVRILRHELVHALLAQQAGGRALPVWFEEGLAQRLACASDGCPSFEFSPKPGNFLDIQDLNQPYISLSWAAARLSYKQSYYLILVLQRESGPQSLSRLVEAIQPNNAVTSDSLLTPLGLTFDELVDRANRYWNQRQTFAEQP